jgi:hypothetical protein
MASDAIFCPKCGETKPKSVLEAQKIREAKTRSSKIKRRNKILFLLVALIIGLFYFDHLLDRNLKSDDSNDNTIDSVVTKDPEIEPEKESDPEPHFTGVVIAEWSGGVYIQTEQENFLKTLAPFTLPENTKEWTVTYRWWNATSEYDTKSIIFIEDPKEVTDILSIDYDFSSESSGTKIFRFQDKYLEGEYQISLNILKIKYEITVEAKIPSNQEKPEIITGEIPKWRTYGKYKVGNDVPTTGNFEISEFSEKIKLSFDITYTTPAPTYSLMIRIMQDGETLWEAGPENFGTTTPEFIIDNINGKVTIWMLIAAGRADFILYWYG